MTTTLPDVLKGFTIEVETPDGKAYVTINELNDVPIEVRVIIGKAGTKVNAWAEALARLASLCLQHGIGIDILHQEISNIRSGDMKVSNGGVSISSGPEGISYAIMRYKKERVKLDKRKYRMDI